MSKIIDCVPGIAEGDTSFSDECGGDPDFCPDGGYCGVC